MLKIEKIYADANSVIKVIILNLIPDSRKHWVKLAMFPSRFRNRY